MLTLAVEKELNGSASTEDAAPRAERAINERRMLCILGWKEDKKKTSLFLRNMLSTGDAFYMPDI